METNATPAGDSPAEQTYTLKDVATAYAYGRSDGRHDETFVVTSDFVAAVVFKDVAYPLFTGFYNTVAELLRPHAVKVSGLEERRDRMILTGDLFRKTHTVSTGLTWRPCVCAIGEDHTIHDEVS